MDSSKEKPDEITLIEQETVFEDGRMSHFIFEKMRRVQLGECFLACLGIFISIFQYELEYELSPEDRHLKSSLMLYVVFFSSIFLVILHFVRFRTYHDLQMNRREIPFETKWYHNPNLSKTVIECVLLFIHPSPFLIDDHIMIDSSYDYYPLELHVNDILAILILYRITIIIQCLLLFTDWYSNSASRLCKMYDAKPGIMFDLKCLMRENPLKLVVLLYSCSIPIFAYCLRIAERPLAKDLNQ